MENTDENIEEMGGYPGGVEEPRWCPGVIFREDGSRTRTGNAALNLNIMRKPALKRLRALKAGKKRYSAKLESYAPCRVTPSSQGLCSESKCRRPGQNYDRTGNSGGYRKSGCRLQGKHRIGTCNNKKITRLNKNMKSELEQIPGIGKNMAQHLINAGYPTIASLKGQNPEEIYFKDCQFQNTQVDRCVLYVYRLAVAYANGTITDPEKLKWWNWKD